jgi:hypothetical protein
MANVNETRKIVSVEFNEEQYLQLTELIDHFQGQSLSTVTKQDILLFLLASAYRNIILKENRQ